jgi:hypothetical protein
MWGLTWKCERFILGYWRSVGRFLLFVICALGIVWEPDPTEHELYSPGYVNNGILSMVLLD